MKRLFLQCTLIGEVAAGTWQSERNGEIFPPYASHAFVMEELQDDQLFLQFLITREIMSSGDIQILLRINGKSSRIEVHQIKLSSCSVGRCRKNCIFHPPDEKVDNTYFKLGMNQSVPMYIWKQNQDIEQAYNWICLYTNFGRVPRRVWFIVYYDTPSFINK